MEINSIKFQKDYQRQASKLNIKDKFANQVANVSTYHCAWGALHPRCSPNAKHIEVFSGSHSDLTDVWFP